MTWCRVYLTSCGDYVCVWWCKVILCYLGNLVACSNLIPPSISWLLSTFLAGRPASLSLRLTQNWPHPHCPPLPPKGWPPIWSMGLMLEDEPLTLSASHLVIALTMMRRLRGASVLTWIPLRRPTLGRSPRGSGWNQVTRDCLVWPVSRNYLGWAIGGFIAQYDWYLGEFLACRVLLLM